MALFCKLFISHRSGGWEVQNQGCWHGWVLVRACFLDCRELPSHCVFTAKWGEGVWARVHVRACMYLCVCSFQKRMSVWQVPQNHSSWLVIWVCILHINLYYSLSFSVISCLLMMNQTSFTISYQFYCFLKSERKDTELHWKKDIKTQLHLFSVYCIHRYPGWLNRGYFRF